MNNDPFMNNEPNEAPSENNASEQNDNANSSFGNSSFENPGMGSEAPETQHYTPTEPASEPCLGFAIASMILAIASVVCCGSLPASVLAIIFSSIARKKGNTSGMATTGFVLGIISTILWVLLILFYFIVIIIAVIVSEQVY